MSNYVILTNIQCKKDDLTTKKRFDNKSEANNCVFKMSSFCIENSIQNFDITLSFFSKHRPLWTENIYKSLTAWQRAIKLLTPTKLQQITKPPTTFHIQLIGDSSNKGYGFLTGTMWGYAAFYADEVDPNNKHNIRERELYRQQYH